MENLDHSTVLTASTPGSPKSYSRIDDTTTSASAFGFGKMPVFSPPTWVGKAPHHTARGVGICHHQLLAGEDGSSQRCEPPSQPMPAAPQSSTRPPSPPAPSPPRHSSLCSRQGLTLICGVADDPCSQHVGDSYEDGPVASSARKELGHSNGTDLPTYPRTPEECQKTNAGLPLYPPPFTDGFMNLPEPSDSSPAVDPLSRRSSDSLSEEDGGRLYARAANVATGVAAASATSASVVLADEATFSLQGHPHRCSPSGATLYARIAQAATGVEAEMETGVSAVPNTFALHDVASDPDLHSTAQHAEAREPLRRQHSTPAPGLPEPVIHENSMHGSSVSGGDIVHASRYAEAFHVATRVAAAAGGESVDPSMHGSSAADDVSSRNTNAAHVATRALHRSDVGDGSSAGASSISFGDDGSRHRHIGAAQVATGGWAMTSPSEGSIHSSISFGASAHNGRYSLATRVASGVFTAAAAADSSVGGSSISFGDDISARRLSPRGGSVAARACLLYTSDAADE